VNGTRWAALLAIGYVGVAGTWILLSSAFAAGSSASVEELERIETVKGVAYVAVTAVALFFAARFALGRIAQRERLLQANERRVFAGLIASSVAHDSNNVLTLALSELEALEGMADPATLERLRAAIDRVVQLNRRLVLATRQNTSSSLAPLALGDAVRDAVGLVRKHPAVRAARVDVSVDDAVLVAATPLLVAQIVTNLVVNAGEATGGAGRIEVRVRRDGAHALVEVDDDGPGIAPERRAGIFDALATTKPDGNGMGLFSVKASVTALGGAVDVEAAPRGGACFRVRVPLYSPPAAGAASGTLNA
jgi:signal transduction histidine kinase